MDIQLLTSWSLSSYTIVSWQSPIIQLLSGLAWMSRCRHLPTFASSLYKRERSAAAAADARDLVGIGVCVTIASISGAHRQQAASNNVVWYCHRIHIPLYFFIAACEHLWGEFLHLLPNPDAHAAISKGMWSVKLHKQFLTGSAD